MCDTEFPTIGLWAYNWQSCILKGERLSCAYGKLACHAMCHVKQNVMLCVIQFYGAIFSFRIEIDEYSNFNEFF